MRKLNQIQPIDGTAAHLRRHLPSGVSLAVATLVAAGHLAAVAPFVMGAKSVANRPPNEGLSTTAAVGEPGQVVSTYVIINDTSIRESNGEPPFTLPRLEDELDRLSKEPLALVTQAVVPPQISSLSDALSDATGVADPLAGAKYATEMFGRYMGQIKARISRAWMAPDEAPRTQFDCLVQIRQSSTGEVREITLQSCDMSPQWQMSLVRAIQRASPLSAPPNEKLFTEVITLSFSGHSANRRGAS